MTIQRRYGVLGAQLAHSHSPALFADRFAKMGIVDATYHRFERPSLEGFGAWLEHEGAVHPPLQGLNITIPYKQSILPFLVDLTDVAKAVGAVNAIKPTARGWIGHNTDVEGFLKPIRPFLRNVHERALILGNGGAAAAVRHGLTSLGIDVIHVTRTDVEGRSIRYEEVSPALLHHCKLVVQCTPVGTYPDVAACVPFPWEGVGTDHLAVDLVYNPAETEFLRRAASKGAETLNGSGMLLAQAEAAWNWWNSPA